MLHSDRDLILSALWMATYTFVLIGTIKYKYPLISPATQIFIGSLENSVVIALWLSGTVGWNYIWIGNLYWALIELVIIVVHIRFRFIPKRYALPYMICYLLMTGIMCYLVVYKGRMFFCNYFNTLIGVSIWYAHIKKKGYPMKPIALVAFVTKFAADSIGILVYWGAESWITNTICVLLPMLDFLFIHAYFHDEENDPGNERMKSHPERGCKQNAQEMRKQQKMG